VVVVQVAVEDEVLDIMVEVIFYPFGLGPATLEIVTKQTPLIGSRKKSMDVSGMGSCRDCVVSDAALDELAISKADHVKSRMSSSVNAGTGIAKTSACARAAVRSSQRSRTRTSDTPSNVANSPFLVTPAGSAFASSARNLA